MVWHWMRLISTFKQMWSVSTTLLSSRTQAVSRNAQCWQPSWSRHTTQICTHCSYRAMCIDESLSPHLFGQPGHALHWAVFHIRCQLVLLPLYRGAKLLHLHQWSLFQMLGGEDGLYVVRESQVVHIIRVHIRLVAETWNTGISSPGSTVLTSAGTGCLSHKPGLMSGDSCQAIKGRHLVVNDLSFVKISPHFCYHIYNHILWTAFISWH